MPSLACRLRPLAPSGFLLLLSAALTGCAFTTSPVQQTAASSQIQGVAQGGQQPVTGATVTLWKAGTSGYGAGAVSLATTTTDSTGSFTLSPGGVKAYSCTASDLIYLTATGGNPGLANNGRNAAIELMSALGPCSSLTTTQFIFVNEVTTAASAYALGQFMSKPAGVLYSTQIGTSSTNLVGLANAFATVNNLVDTSTGNSPGPNAPQGSILPSALLYSLANSLASCVNSDGSLCTAPGMLFPSATPSGGVAPVDTLQAALNVALNPASNVAAIFGTASAMAPYVGLASAPNDWTAEIAYNGSIAGSGTINIPFALAVDSVGNVWTIDNAFTASTATPGNPATGGNAATVLSNSGAPISGANGFANQTLFSNPRGIAIDLNDNAWVSNDGTVSGKTTGGTTVGPANSNLLFTISPGGTVGTIQTGTSTGTALDQPYGVAIDGTGNVFFASQALKQVGAVAAGASTVTLPAIGKSVTPTTPLPPVADANGNVWAPGNSSTGGLAYIAAPLGGGAGAGTTTTFTAAPFNVALGGLAIDSSNNAWVANQTGAIYNVDNAGNVLQTCSNSSSLTAPRFIAVDGDGNIWAANLKNPGWVVGFSPTCQLLSGSTGFGAGAASLMQNPRSVAVDSSGNLWIANNLTGASGSKTIVEIVGAAAPTVTPLALALKNNKAGRRP